MNQKQLKTFLQFLDSVDQSTTIDQLRQKLAQSIAKEDSTSSEKRKLEDSEDLESYDTDAKKAKTQDISYEYVALDKETVSKDSLVATGKISDSQPNSEPSQQSLSKDQPPKDKSQSPARSADTHFGQSFYNLLVLLYIDPKKSSDGEINAYFTSLRSDTEYGKKQADHAIPVRFILQYLAATVFSETLPTVCSHVHDRFRTLMDDFDEKEDELQLNFLETPSITPYPEHSNHYEKLGIRYENSIEISKYLSDILRCYGKCEAVSFINKPHIGGGNYVFENINIFNAIEFYTELAQQKIPQEKKEKEFYKKFLETHGEFVNGAGHLFAEEIKEYQEGKRSELGEYKKTGIMVLREKYPDTETGRAQLFQDFSRKCNSKTICTLLVEMFDFPYQSNRETYYQQLLQKYIKMYVDIYPKTVSSISEGSFIEGAITIGEEFEKQFRKFEVICKRIGEPIDKDSVSLPQESKNTATSWNQSSTPSQNWQQIFVNRDQNQIHEISKKDTIRKAIGIVQESKIINKKSMSDLWLKLRSIDYKLEQGESYLKEEICKQVQIKFTALKIKKEQFQSFENRFLNNEK